MAIAINRTTWGLIIGVCLVSNLFGSQVPPAWQNPDIGLTVDAVIDAHDASGSWQSPGLSLRGAELIISANIDPYAFLVGNVLFSQLGAELHEAFVEFPALPLNLKLRGGLLLANFGRWNRFHAHAMPFVTEPRIYSEYTSGMLALRGVELSWLMPFTHYIEVTASVYDLIDGHTHDTDPPDNSPDMTADKVAEMIGAVPHGGHYDYKGRHIYDESELFAIANEELGLNLPIPNNPRVYRGLNRPGNFAYGGRITTSFEFGTEVSADVGGSLLYQGLWKESLRTDEGFPQFYDKLLWGADVTFFWHPLTFNRYRNLQVGIEFIGSRENFEQLYPSRRVIEAFRTGGIFHTDYQLTQQWHIGGFGSMFQSNDQNKDTRIHAGGYVTFAITHYQYIRLEYSRYEYPGFLDGVNRVRLQYDATIGYHTHGRQR
ncbi:Zinc-regulated TonB-dependent outer membrane receptor [Chitinispirillum alkaliphilum]|nr:Zinc-regulated TonB-dependent outer membrane receptor [Chitinispirillum alkaliphilum]